jgi:hypothetical protein
LASAALTVRITAKRSRGPTFVSSNVSTHVWAASTSNGPFSPPRISKRCQADAGWAAAHCWAEVAAGTVRRPVLPCRGGGWARKSRRRKSSRTSTT